MVYDGICFHILIEVGMEIVHTHFLVRIIIIKEFTWGASEPPPSPGYTKKSPVWVGLMSRMADCTFFVKRVIKVI